MNLTNHEKFIYQAGFVSGQEDIGAVLIAMLISDGRTSVGLNELSEMICMVTEMCSNCLPEYVMELLEDIKEESNVI